MVSEIYKAISMIAQLTSKGEKVVLLIGKFDDSGFSKVFKKIKKAY